MTPFNSSTSPMIELLNQRASCRNFTDQKISPEDLQTVFEAGVHSASGGNLQPFAIIQIESAETKQKIFDLDEQPFILSAQVLLVFCIDFRRLQRWAELEVAPFTAPHAFRHFWISFQDTLICAQNICTAADALGLGSVYDGMVIDYLPQIRQILELPKGVLPVVLVALGHPVSRPEPRKKLTVADLVHLEKYHDPDNQQLLESYQRKYVGPGVHITPERLATIQEVCEKVHGTDFAEKCLARIREEGKINPAQNYFGLHYRADEMPSTNREMLQNIEEAGFSWFNPF